VLDGKNVGIVGPQQHNSTPTFRVFADAASAGEKRRLLLSGCLVVQCHPVIGEQFVDSAVEPPSNLGEQVREIGQLRDLVLSTGAHQAEKGQQLRPLGASLKRAGRDSAHISGTRSDHAK